MGCGGNVQTLMDFLFLIAAMIGFILCLSPMPFDDLRWSYDSIAYGNSTATYYYNGTLYANETVTGSSGTFVGHVFLTHLAIRKINGTIDVPKHHVVPFTGNRLCEKEFYEKYNLNGKSSSCQHVLKGTQVVLACVGISFIFCALAFISGIMGFFLEKGYSWSSFFLAIPFCTGLISIIIFVLLVHQNFEPLLQGPSYVHVGVQYVYTFYILIAAWCCSLISLGGFSAQAKERDLQKTKRPSEQKLNEL